MGLTGSTTGTWHNETGALERLNRKGEREAHHRKDEDPGHAGNKL